MQSAPFWICVVLSPGDKKNMGELITNDCARSPSDAWTHNSVSEMAAMLLSKSNRGSSPVCDLEITYLNYI